MTVESPLIDRIVAGVLQQLAADADVAPGNAAAEPPQTERRSDPSISPPVPRSTGEGSVSSISATLVTADVLAAALNGSTRVVVPARAIVTPAAWDAARERRVEIVRGDVALAARVKVTSEKTPRPAASHSLLVVVRSTAAVEQLWDELQANWRRELLSCPDDAAALATSALCRGDASTIVILAEQTHRAACLANRNEQVKAVAIQNTGEIRTIRKHLRANVWCIDPTGRSWFELRNTLRAIVEKP